MANTNEFYTVYIEDIVYSKAMDIVKAFADRDIKIEMFENIGSEYEEKQTEKSCDNCSMKHKCAGFIYGDYWCWRPIAIDNADPGMYTMIIKEIREVTMTPFMIWFLHHVDNGDYCKLVIS